MVECRICKKPTVPIKQEFICFACYDKITRAKTKPMPLPVWWKRA